MEHQFSLRKLSEYNNIDWVSHIDIGPKTQKNEVVVLWENIWWLLDRCVAKRINRRLLIFAIRFPSYTKHLSAAYTNHLSTVIRNICRRSENVSVLWEPSSVVTRKAPFYVSGFHADLSHYRIERCLRLRNSCNLWQPAQGDSPVRISVVTS